MMNSWEDIDGGGGDENGKQNYTKASTATSKGMKILVEEHNNPFCKRLLSPEGENFTGKI